MSTPKPQANTLDEILDKIECYMWDEDDEPTIDAVTLLTAKAEIQALIAQELDKALTKIASHEGLPKEVLVKDLETK